ncbi:DUF4873 domain-containing protein [Paractinoplanes globisporus]|uniref:DUF4873 domain-containing protein n=1 Tax=Paractinoplanes globisporus TaxID=113565 RepID=A0ABW6WTF7_9ACTN|nr:DUF4873 domain-containing protein [Actinoplanes globisporus]
METESYQLGNLPDEEYRGPATLRVGDAELPVTIRVSAHFEPIEGRFRWAGRTTPDAELRERVGAGAREAELTIPGARQATARLSDPDPWGGIRLSGTGTPPWFR